jgi:hypothetical protein
MRKECTSKSVVLDDGEFKLLSCLKEGGQLIVLQNLC